MRLPMSASRAWRQRAALLLAALCVCTALSVSPAQADWRTKTCEYVPFAAVLCVDKIYDAVKGSVSGAVSFATDPLGYLSTNAANAFSSMFLSMDQDLKG